MNRTCDVFVLGAGVSGVPAAVVAARAGASVLLAERRSTPGGAGVTALHQAICGLYAGGAQPTAPLNGGIASEICDRLQSRAPANVPTRVGRTYVLPYSNQDLGSVYADMLSAEPNIQVLYDATHTEACVEHNSVKTVTLQHEGRNITVTPHTVIDCSGTGALLAAADAACPTPAPDERQLAGFTVLLGGAGRVDDALSIRGAYALRAAADSGRLPRRLMFSSLRDAGRDGACLKISRQATNPPGSTADALADVALLLRILGETIPELSDVTITRTAETVMDRDGPRLRGKYVLTESDVLTARKFPAASVRGAWPVEFWHGRTGPSCRYLPDGDWYEIPPDCLRSDSIPNLLCAGRCISGTPAALASTRVMGICMALGEAAGLLAASMPAR